ncbi:MAG TPA: GNAT family N-acetyltransferase [Candidatus Eisenbacteria bacterium]|nr:GNAT family N-acetyltransferase [Candidatus Eisenbacteria bacterium]
MEIEPVALGDLVALRRAKVDELRVRAFSWGHEKAIASTRAFRLREGHAETGYALASETALLEFAVSPAWRTRANEALAAAVMTLGLGEILVRTDDGLACEAALGLASRERWDARPAGPIYALETGVLSRPSRPAQAEVRAVGAGEATAATAILEQDSSIEPELRTSEGVALAAREERLWGLTRGGSLVGVAIAVPLATHRYTAIRPAVLPAHRRAGLATYLVGEVSQALLLANRRLIAEADVLDRGPRRIAEHLGLTLAAHRLRLRHL